MAEAAKTVEPESNVQKAAVASDSLEESKGKKGETKPSKAIVDVTKEEQERNDARKADKVDDANAVGTGLPPVTSTVDPLIPVPVSTDASKAEQEKAVAIQSHSRVDSDEKAKVTLKSGGTVTVPTSQARATTKFRSGGLITFRNVKDDEDVVVDSSDVAKVEAA
jgi:hypothetical protein